MIVRALVGAAIILAGCFFGAHPGSACVSISTTFDDAFRAGDVVLQATIVSIRESYEMVDDSSRPIDTLATLSVTRVWKGHAQNSEKLAYTQSTSACGFTLELGQPVILFAQRTSKGPLYTTAHGVGGLGVRFVDGAFLERYRVQTDELHEKARSGGAEEGFALGAYLTHWGDGEALKVYQDLLNRYDRDADAYLGIGIARSRRGDFAESEAAFRNAASIEPRLKSILETGLEQPPLGANDRWTLSERATFLLLGEFVEYGRDWSGLPLNPKCSGEGATFWHDYFDASDMTACAFRRSKFEEVSFVATKLAGVPFDFADLKVVDFSNADLNGASFKSAHLANVTWAGADLRNADFARTRAAGPFKDVDLRGASFAGALRPGPFIASGRDKKFSLDGVSFRGATVAISAFLLTPENTMADSPRADIGGADFTDVVLDCGERNREQMKQSLKSARDLLLPSYRAEQELASQIRDTWSGVTLTERCREFLATDL